MGTDIAELLLRDHRTVWLPGKSPNEANLIDFTNEAVEQVEEEESGEAQLSFLTDSQTVTSSVLEKETERFRELLLYGRKKVGSPADVFYCLSVGPGKRDQLPLGSNCRECRSVSVKVLVVFLLRRAHEELQPAQFSHLESVVARLCVEPG